VTDSNVKLREVWSTSQPVKTLSSARVFLFGARDTWFVVAVPVYLHTVFTQAFSLNAQQAFFTVGAFLSLWVIGYGFVQAKTPKWLSSARQSSLGAVKAVKLWSAALLMVLLMLSNAAGRLLGTLLSGLSYQFGGLALCLATAAMMVTASWWFARALSHMPRHV